MPEPAPSGMTLQPMAHVEQMRPAVAFYQALSASVLHGSRDGDFVLLAVRAAGVRIEQPAGDEAFGKQPQVATPDGLLVKVNQLEPDLHLSPLELLPRMCQAPVSGARRP